MLDCENLHYSVPFVTVSAVISLFIHLGKFVELAVQMNPGKH